MQSSFVSGISQADAYRLIRALGGDLIALLRDASFSGTLMNESISTSAGAPHGQFLHPAEMRKWIRDARRTPVPRSTTYRTLRSFEQEPAEAEPSWIHDRFGSYGQLIASQEFRFRDRHEGCR